MWSASARHAYDTMEKRAFSAEAKLASTNLAYDAMEAQAKVAGAKLVKTRNSINEGIDVNVTSHDTLSWKAAMMRALNDMLNETSESLEPDRIFEVATRTICQYLDTSSVYICDWNPEEKTTTVLAEYFGEKASEKERFSDVGFVYQLDEEFERRLTQESYWISYHDDDSLTVTEAFQYDTYEVKVSIYVPMYAGKQIIGYIEAWDTSERRDFTKQQIDFLVYITHQIAGSVRIAHLYRALSASEERYRILMNTIEGGVAQVDMNGTIQFVNRHFATMLNMPIKNILHRNLETLWQQKATATAIKGEYRLDKEDGSSIWVQVIHAPIPGETSNFIGEAVVYSDITRRKEAEKLQIRMALENERISLLAGFIKDTSHEFYTPISIINTRLFLLRKQNEDEELLKGLNVIEEQADNITALIKALVEMTKLDAKDILPRQNYNITLLLEQIVTKYEPIAASSQKTLHFEADDDKIMLAVDAERLSLAFDEIVKNALAYTAEYGTIIIRVREREEHIQIIVKDTGIGMSDESKRRAFERLYRADGARSTPGFGLGLSIAKRVIDLHNGNITIESTPGEGTSFVIMLPQFRI